MNTIPIPELPVVAVETVFKWLGANCKRVGWSIDFATYEITDSQACELVAIVATTPYPAIDTADKHKEPLS